MTVLAQLISGHETFKGVSAKIMLFYRRAPGDEERPLFIAAKDKHSGVVPIGSGETLQASSQNINCGQWTINRVHLPERSFVKVFIQRKLTGDFMPKTQQVMLCWRQEAALRRMRIALTEAADANQTAGYVEGNFDIIMPDMFEDLGIAIEDRYLRYFQPDEDEGWFYTCEVLSRETSSLRPRQMAKIETKRGVVTVPAGSRRTLIIRKKG